MGLLPDFGKWGPLGRIGAYPGNPQNGARRSAKPMQRHSNGGAGLISRSVGLRSQGSGWVELAISWKKGQWTRE